MALFFQYVVAIPMAVVSAVRQNSAVDYGLTFISFIGMSIPNFLLALVLLVVLFKLFPSFPIGGLFSQEFQGDTPWTMAKVVDLFQHLLVPVIVVAMSSTAGTLRTLRATLLDEFGMEYMRVARAKGLSERQIIYKYPLRIALNPIIASVGWSLPIIVSGAVLISIVTNIPDIGPVLFQALRSQDSYLAGAIVFMLSALTILGTLLSDVLLAMSDPRISFAGGKS
jgi:peptide/nickel transport system permease protein